MERPRCRRCGKPLALWEEDGGWRLVCTLVMDDEDFWAYWDNLPGDEVVRLTKQIEGQNNVGSR